MLEVNDVSVEYAGIVAVDSVSVTVGRGEAVGIIGGNGAGKSSLLKAISGIVSHSGTISLDGEQLTGRPAHEIPHLGVAHVPEGSRLFSDLTVQQNLAMGAYARGGPAPEDFERVYELFPKLAERRNQTAGTLSGGERQMGAIGRGLMLRPKLLLLDEPSLGIAPVVIERIYGAIVELIAEGQTIVLVEQNVAECLDVVSRAYVLQTGSVVHSGPADELSELEEVRSAYLGL